MPTPPSLPTPVQPSLPQDDSNSAARADALDVERDTYRFVYDWPAGVATCSWLPSADDYSKSYGARAVPIYGDIGANYTRVAGVVAKEKKELKLLLRFSKNAVEERSLLKDILLSAFQEPSRELAKTRPPTWRDYQNFFQSLREPKVVSMVQDPSTLGDILAWQRVGGANPTVLSRVDRLPDHFPVTDAVFRSVMGEHDSLATAAAERRLYLADYAALDGIACGITDESQKYLAAPLAVYAVDRASGHLRTVAVQCGQSPDANPVFTPADGWKWRMACHTVQVADANHHEGFAHLGRTHLVMEAVTVAAKRRLAASHPLYILLMPHTESTLAINHSAKTSLIAPGGTVDITFSARIRSFGDLVRQGLATQPLASATPARDLAARGLDDTASLPNHPYREDSQPVWSAIRTFVGEYVALYYTSNARVSGDTELQGFLRELGAQDGGRIPGVPEVATIPQLAELITTILWIATAQHSAVNFPQYEFMAYPPNMAGAMYTAAPTASSPNTEEAFAAMLPPGKVVLESMSMVYLLSGLRDSTLGDYAHTAFADPRVVPALTRYKLKLAAVDLAIAERDKNRYYSYPYLRPSQILQSISI